METFPRPAPDSLMYSQAGSDQGEDGKKKNNSNYKAPPKKTDERDERQRVHASTVFFGGAFQTKCSKKSYVYRGEVKNGRKSRKI